MYLEGLCTQIFIVGKSTEEMNGPTDAKSAMMRIYM